MVEKLFSNSEKGQKEYYDKIAAKYDRYHTNPYAVKYRYTCYGRMFQGIDFKGLKVLDAMCGGGDVTEYLLQKGASVTGLDISESFCKIYKARFKDCNIVCSSILRTEFPSSSFDAAVITGGLHHLHPHVNQGINEIARILKPSAYFCFFEPNAGSIVDVFRKIWYRMDKRYFQENEEAIDIDDIMKKHKYHFEVTKTKYGGNLAYLFVSQAMIFRIPPGLIKYYAPFLLWLEKVIDRFQLSLFSWWVFCLMRKKA